MSDIANENENENEKGLVGGEAERLAVGADANGGAGESAGAPLNDPIAGGGGGQGCCGQGKCKSGKGKKKKESLGQTIKSLAILIFVICAIRSVVIDWNDVPTGSMNPTIMEGDRIVVNHLAYNLRVPFFHWQIFQWGEPQRGDIVTFKSPLDGNRNVKRVVGVPGDRFEVVNGRLKINGQMIAYRPLAVVELGKEPFTEVGVGPAHTVQFEEKNTERVRREICLHQQWKAGKFRGKVNPEFAKVYPKDGPGPEDLSNFVYQAGAGDEKGIIPAGEYFMMGDNRTNSKDSRARGYSSVPMRNIYGRAFGVAANFNLSEWKFLWDRYFIGLQ